MTDKLFIKRLQQARDTPSAYMWGTYGKKITKDLISAKARQYPSRYTTARIEYLNKRADGITCGWDCAGLIKGILWGWTPTTSPKYDVNTDLNASGIISKCKEIASPVPGCACYMPGHIAVYVGDGKIIEATLRGSKDGVVTSELSDLKWTKYGLLPWIEYETRDPYEFLRQIKKEIDSYLEVNG